MPFEKGHEKIGGKTKGTINRLTAEYKELIAASDPVSFLIKAYTVGIIDEEKLTLKERCDIARDLLKKLVPDMKAVELGNTDGEPFILRLPNYRELLDKRDRCPEGLPAPTIPA